MKRLLIALTMAIGLLAGPLLVSQPAGAVDVFKACSANPDTTVCKGTGDKILESNGILAKVINLLLVIIGIVAVIMIIVGGIKYTTSAGDSSQTKQARDTIVYAVVGLVLAIGSFGLVNFVLSKI